MITSYTAKLFLLRLLPGFTSDSSSHEQKGKTEGEMKCKLSKFPSSSFLCEFNDNTNARPKHYPIWKTLQNIISGRK